MLIEHLEIYVNDLKSGIVEKDGQPVTIKESAATALVDGKNSLGPVVGNYCMNIAIEVIYHMPLHCNYQYE